MPSQPLYIGADFGYGHDKTVYHYFFVDGENDIVHHPDCSCLIVKISSWQRFKNKVKKIIKGILGYARIRQY